MPHLKSINSYPPDWPEISEQVKVEAGYCCERCRHPHDPESGYTLTTHHLDRDKANCARWNLAALCQRCHLYCQAKIFLPQFFMFEPSDWFKPHVMGYYESIGISVNYEGGVLIMITEEVSGEQTQEPRAS